MQTLTGTFFKDLSELHLTITIRSVVDGPLMYVLGAAKMFDLQKMGKSDYAFLFLLSILLYIMLQLSQHVKTTFKKGKNQPALLIIREATPPRMALEL